MHEYVVGRESVKIPTGLCIIIIYGNSREVILTSVLFYTVGILDFHEAHLIMYNPRGH